MCVCAHCIVNSANTTRFPRRLSIIGFARALFFRASRFGVAPVDGDLAWARRCVRVRNKASFCAMAMYRLEAECFGALCR